MAVNLSDDTVGRPQKDVFNAQARQCHWGQERVGVGEVGVGRGGGGYCRRDGGGKVVHSWWQGMMRVHAGAYGSDRVYAIYT